MALFEMNVFLSELQALRADETGQGKARKGSLEEEDDGIAVCVFTGGPHDTALGIQIILGVATGTESLYFHEYVKTDCMHAYTLTCVDSSAGICTLARKLPHGGWVQAYVYTLCFQHFDVWVMNKIGEFNLTNVNVAFSDSVMLK